MKILSLGNSITLGFLINLNRIKIDGKQEKHIFILEAIENNLNINGACFQEIEILEFENKFDKFEERNKIHFHIIRIFLIWAKTKTFKNTFTCLTLAVRGFLAKNNVVYELYEWLSLHIPHLN